MSERAFYVFCCLKEGCGDDARCWRAFRCQLDASRSRAAAAHASGTAAAAASTVVTSGISETPVYQAAADKQGAASDAAATLPTAVTPTTSGWDDAADDWLTPASKASSEPQASASAAALADDWGLGSAGDDWGAAAAHAAPAAAAAGSAFDFSDLNAALEASASTPAPKKSKAGGDKGTPASGAAGASTAVAAVASCSWPEPGPAALQVRDCALSFACCGCLLRILEQPACCIALVDRTYQDREKQPFLNEMQVPPFYVTADDEAAAIAAVRSATAEAQQRELAHVRELLERYEADSGGAASTLQQGTLYYAHVQLYRCVTCCQSPVNSGRSTSVCAAAAAFVIPAFAVCLVSAVCP